MQPPYPTGAMTALHTIRPKPAPTEQPAVHSARHPASAAMAMLYVVVVLGGRYAEGYAVAMI